MHGILVDLLSVLAAAVGYSVATGLLAIGGVLVVGAIGARAERLPTRGGHLAPAAPPVRGMPPVRHPYRRTGPGHPAG